MVDWCTNWSLFVVTYPRRHNGTDYDNFTNLKDTDEYIVNRRSYGLFVAVALRNDLSTHLCRSLMKPLLTRQKIKRVNHSRSSCTILLFTNKFTEKRLSFLFTYTHLT